MNDPIDEQLSAFIDGELSEQELELLMARIDRDSSRRATLSRYGQIGALLRDGGFIPTADGLADRVRDALAADDAPVTRRRSLPRFAVAGWGAIAASVAAVVIFWGGPQSSPAPGAGLAGEASTAQVRPVSVNEYRDVSTQTTALRSRETARLTTYLVYHGRHTGSLSGRVVDARLLGRNMERAELRRVEYRTGD